MSTARKIEGWFADENVQARVFEALAGYMDGRAFLSQCILCAKDPGLADCSAATLFDAFLVCAQMGLLPGKHHGHVALIPRGGSVTVMPQWQGFKFLMESQPGIRGVEAVLVHVLDDFAIRANGDVLHAFDPFDPDRVFLHPADRKPGEPAGLRGGYLKITFDDGRVAYHFTSEARIEKARLCSDVPDLTRKGSKGVWRLWYEAQALKSVYRDAWARRAVPISPTIAARIGDVAERDDFALGNDPGKRSETAGPAMLAHDPGIVARPRGVDAVRERLRSARGSAAPLDESPLFDEQTGEVGGGDAV